MYVILGFGARERRLVYVRFLRVGGRRLLRCECYCEYMCVIIFGAQESHHFSLRCSDIYNTVIWDSVFQCFFLIWGDEIHDFEVF